MKNILNTLINESNIEKIKNNTLIKGKVISIDNKFITIDVNLKSESKIPISEFDKDIENIKIGDQIEVLLEEIQNNFGTTITSYKKAKLKKQINYLENSFKKNEIIIGEIIDKIKGGFEINLNGVKAFLPGSLVNLHEIKTNIPLEFKIIKFDPEKNNIVVSKKIENEKKNKINLAFNNFYINQKIKGTVKNLTEYGAFINLGEIDGLVHITDISWKRIKHPKEVLNINDEVEVIILKKDEKEMKIYLGIKQLKNDPWNEIYKKYPKNTKIIGKITNFTNYGIFVEIEPGIEGLLHNSYIKNANINKDTLKTNEKLEVIILTIDPKNKKIALNIEKKI